MKAMVLEALADVRTNLSPLRLLSLPEPTLAEDEVLLRVTRCGVVTRNWTKSKGGLRLHVCQLCWDIRSLELWSRK